MTGNPFENNELCDGKHCGRKETCARWMMRCDIAKCTPWVNLHTKPWKRGCPFWLAIPNKNYPQKTNDADY